MCIFMFPSFHPFSSMFHMFPQFFAIGFIRFHPVFLMFSCQPHPKKNDTSAPRWNGITCCWTWPRWNQSPCGLYLGPPCDSIVVAGCCCPIEVLFVVVCCLLLLFVVVCCCLLLFVCCCLFVVVCLLLFVCCCLFVVVCLLLFVVVCCCLLLFVVVCCCLLLFVVVVVVVVVCCCLLLLLFVVVCCCLLLFVVVCCCLLLVVVCCCWLLLLLLLLWLLLLLLLVGEIVINLFYSPRTNAWKIIMKRLSCWFLGKQHMKQIPSKKMGRDKNGWNRKNSHSMVVNSTEVVIGWYL